MGRRGGSIAAATGLLAAAMIGAGCALIGDLPDPGASGQDVYAFFLDHRDQVRAGTALLVIGLTLLLAFAALLRARLGDGGRGAASLSVGAAAIAIAAGIAAAAAVGALALGAEDAAPESSRAVLDLATAAAAAAGPLTALALVAATIAMRRARLRAPAMVAVLGAAAALACLLWLAPLVTDAGWLGPGSLLGSTLGMVLVLAWIAAAALWLAGSGPRDPQYVSSTS